MCLPSTTTGDIDSITSETSSTSALSRVEWLPAGEDLAARIKAFKPDILCFDFDSPKPVEMLLLRQIKAALPSVPILMLSRRHSADLVLWALRSRVWNYFEKPLSAPDFLAAVHELCGLLQERQGSRRMVMPSVAVASEAQPVNTRSAQAVNKAKAYVQANLGEDLTAAKLAEVCFMSYFHFSRTFKRISGESFNDFVQKGAHPQGRRVAGTPQCYDHSRVLRRGVQGSLLFFTGVPAGRWRITDGVP